MADCNYFEALRKFDECVLAEIVREAEVRLQAQLDIATAADQRALTFAGFQIAAATAALGAGVALFVGDRPNPLLAGISVAFALAMLAAAIILVGTVRPAKFCVPGNRPANWLPASWMGDGTDFSLKQARIEQAATLDEMITDNARAATRAAKRVHLSMDLTVWAVGIAGLLLALIFSYETLTIHEPTSEIVAESAADHS